jgi:hypothetical protein
MKKLLGDAELEEARSSASPVQNITSCNRSADFGIKKYEIFYTRIDSRGIPKSLCV